MRRPPNLTRTLSGAALALLLTTTAACGSDRGGSVDAGDTTTAPKPASTAAWYKESVDLDVGADTEPQLLTDGDQAVIVTTSEDGEVTGHTSTDGGPVEAGTPFATEAEYLKLGAGGRLGDDWFVLGSGGTEEIDGDEQPRKDAVVLRSADGLDWTAVDATGFSGPVDIEEGVVADDAFVVVGSRREEGDPGSEQFEARAWRSTDGATWEETSLTDATRESYASDVVDAGDRLLALGGIRNDTVAWSSDDQGATWDRATLPGTADGARINHLTGDGDVLVATGTVRPENEDDEIAGKGHVVYRSTDGGRSWTAAATPPPDQGELWGYATTGREGRFFLTTSTFTEAWSQPELCYADIRLCRQDSEVALYTSTDGDRWARVDTLGFGEGEAGEITSLATLDDGTVIAMSADETGWTVGSWPGDVDLPTMGEPTKPRAEIDLLEEGDPVEVGHRYAAPLHIHCGMDWLYLAGEPWQRTDDGPDVETGAGEAASEDWPVAQQTIFGFATRVDENTVEYSIGEGDDAEVIATYGTPKVDPPGCM